MSTMENRHRHDFYGGGGASLSPVCDRQAIAPLYEAMMTLLGAGITSFSTPGHRQGRGMANELSGFFTSLGASADTSLMESLGTIEHSTGALAAAEQLAAELHGADAAIFSVNGTTSLLHAMLLGVLCPGDAILLPRNVHRSVVGGVLLAGLSPIYMEVTYDRAFGIVHGVAPETVEQSLRAHEEVRAVLIVSPTYYGMASDVRRIADIVHAAGRLLLVDEAHGAHLGMSDRLPVSAMAAGADMAAQSTHKLTGALTQASTLLLRDARIDVARVRRAAALLQSTSQNYLLLASLDLARKQFAMEGGACIERSIDLSLALRERLAALDGLRVLDTSSLDGAGAYALDLLKLTVNVASLGITGETAATFLRETRGIGAELADAENVLFIISYADTEETVERLYDGLKTLCRHYGRYACAGDGVPISTGVRLCTERGGRMVQMPCPSCVLTPREAFFAPTEHVDFSAAEGRVAGETLYFYPPGIPIVAAGERLTREVLDALRSGTAAGLIVHGAADANLEKIQVIIHG